MGIGTILVGLALVVIVAILIAMPLLEPGGQSVEHSANSRERDSLELERATIVRTIRELDFDFRTGKMDESDYKVLREAQVRRGADVLQTLDALPLDAPSEPEDEAQQRGEPDAGEGADVPPVSAPGACPSCRVLIQPGVRFCPNCGTRIAKDERSAITAR